MQLLQRIETIVNLTIDDFYSNGFSSNKTRESLVKTITDELMQVDLIEDYDTYKVSIIVLDKFQAIDIVDFNFIMDTLIDDVEIPEFDIEIPELNL